MAGIRKKGDAYYCTFRFQGRRYYFTVGDVPEAQALAADGQIDLVDEPPDGGVGVPVHFLNNNQAMNVRPRNYAWPDFHDRVIELVRDSFSGRALWRRFNATAGMHARR